MQADFLNEQPQKQIINTEASNHIFGLSALIGSWSSVSIRRIISKLLNVCPFDYTAVTVSGKVGYPLTGLPTPVGWLLLL